MWTPSRLPRTPIGAIVLVMLSVSGALEAKVEVTVFDSTNCTGSSKTTYVLEGGPALLVDFERSGSMNNRTSSVSIKTTSTAEMLREDAMVYFFLDRGFRGRSLAYTARGNLYFLGSKTQNVLTLPSGFNNAISSMLIVRLVPLMEVIQGTRSVVLDWDTQFRLPVQADAEEAAREISAEGDAQVSVQSVWIDNWFDFGGLTTPDAMELNLVFSVNAGLRTWTETWRYAIETYVSSGTLRADVTLVEAKLTPAPTTTYERIVWNQVNASFTAEAQEAEAQMEQELNDQFAAAFASFECSRTEMISRSQDFLDLKQPLLLEVFSQEGSTRNRVISLVHGQPR